jgi:hypothetical protein
MVQQYTLGFFFDAEVKRDSPRLGIFLPDTRYSRRTLSIDRHGAVVDEPGEIPEFDRKENEPNLRESDPISLIQQILEQLKKSQTL